MSKVNINEIFGPTVQGEGKRAGRLCMFIRTNGCNLRCQFPNPDGKTTTNCDTPYTSWNPEKANMMSVESIANMIDKLINESGHKVEDIIITGGEPFLQKGIPDLINELKSRRKKYYITVETNGTIYKANNADLISMSPKLTSSIPGIDFRAERNIHIMNRKFNNSVPAFDEQADDIQYKFVYSKESDIEEIKSFIKEFNINPTEVWLMTQGEDLKTQLEHTTACMDSAIRHGFNFTSRLHVLAYGTKRGV